MKPISNAPKQPKWIADGKPEGASIPIVGSTTNGVQNYRTAEKFPVSKTYYDAKGDDSFNLTDKTVKGVVLGRVIPYDNGDAKGDPQLKNIGWEAIVETNADPLIIPEHKPDGIGSTPIMVGQFKTLEAAEEAVEKAVAKLAKGEVIHAHGGIKVPRVSGE